MQLRILQLLVCLAIAHAEPVRILPLGDSITEGGGQTCYRVPSPQAAAPRQALMRIPFDSPPAKHDTRCG